MTRQTKKCFLPKRGLLLAAIAITANLSAKPPAECTHSDNAPSVNRERTDRCAPRLFRTEKFPLSVQRSSDGSTLLIVSQDNPPPNPKEPWKEFPTYYVTAVDVASGKKLFQTECGQSRISPLFLPNQKNFLIASRNTVSLVSLEPTPQARKLFTVQARENNDIRALNVTPSGQILVGDAFHHFSLIDPQSGKSTQEFDHPGGDPEGFTLLPQVSFLEKGAQVVTLSQAKSVGWHDLKNKKSLGVLDLWSESADRWTIAGSKLLRVSKFYREAPQRYEASITDLVTRQSKTIAQGDLLNGSLSPDARKVILHDGFSTRIIDLASGKSEVELEDLDVDPVKENVSDFSADRRLFFTLSTRDERRPLVRVWNADGSLLYTVPSSPPTELIRMESGGSRWLRSSVKQFATPAFSPDARDLLLAGPDKEVAIIPIDSSCRNLTEERADQTRFPRTVSPAFKDSVSVAAQVPPATERFKHVTKLHRLFTELNSTPAALKSQAPLLSKILKEALAMGGYRQLNSLFIGESDSKTSIPIVDRTGKSEFGRVEFADDGRPFITIHTKSTPYVLYGGRQGSVILEIRP